MKVPAEIFRAYDIRGIVGRTLTADIAREIGRALGSVGRERGAPTFAVGRDGRLSGPELAAALTQGLSAAGADVIDIGMAPTPVTYFAAHHLGCGSCVSITGSHNPPDYNGLKVVVGGNTLYGDDISSPALEVVLGNVVLTVVERFVDRLVVTAEGSPGTPIASGTTLSAGEMPLVVRRRLSPTRTRSSNLLAVRLLPTLTSATLAGNDLQLQGVLLGNDTDDVIVVLYRPLDGATVRMLDTVTTTADQQTLTVPGAAKDLPAGTYQVILRVNNQQAKASPSVVVP